MVCMRDAFHKNDGKDENDTDSYEQGIECLVVPCSGASFACPDQTGDRGGAISPPNRSENDDRGGGVICIGRLH